MKWKFQNGMRVVVVDLHRHADNNPGTDPEMFTFVGKTMTVKRHTPEGWVEFEEDDEWVWAEEWLECAETFEETETSDISMLM